MDTATERRIEQRYNYNWPVWFAEDFNNILSQGQMFDLSSSGAAFTCYADACPFPGQNITARFSVPRNSSEDQFDLENFVQSGYVCRVQEISPYIRKVAVQFASPLPFKPAVVNAKEKPLSNAAH